MNVKKERRDFLHACWQRVLLLPVFGFGVMGCARTFPKKGVTHQDSTAEANPCDNLAGVPPADVEKRKSLGYTNLSPIPDNRCSNCQLFVPSKAGTDCGGCLLFAGPVSPEGYCTYWAPVV